MLLAVAGWSCSDSSTNQKLPPLTHPPDAIAHFPPGSEIVAQDSLYRIIPDSLLTNHQQKQLTDILKSNKYITSVHLAHYNSNIGALLKRADTLAFPMSTDTAYVAIKDYFNVSTPTGNPSAISWGGDIPPRSRGDIMVNYIEEINRLHGHINFKMPFIVGLNLQKLNDSTLAVIQAKKPPPQRVIM